MNDVIGYRIFMHGGLSGGGHGGGSSGGHSGGSGDGHYNGGYFSSGRYKGSKRVGIPPWKLETIFDGEETLPMEGVLGIKKGNR